MSVPAVPAALCCISALSLSFSLCATSCCYEAFRGRGLSAVCQEEAGLSVVVAQTCDTAGCYQLNKVQRDTWIDCFHLSVCEN